MKERIKDIIEQGDKLFSAKGPLDSLMQKIADHFYPERADFTTQRSMGDEFASHLMTGWPVLMRRELGNSVAAMLRPRGKKWFRARTDSEQVNQDPEARAWLDWASDTQMRVMYARSSQFMRATKEGDNDFITFGQAVLSREVLPDGSGLLYRCWHLRDCAWCENERQEVDTIHIKWEPTIRELKRLFPGKLAGNLETELAKNPYRKVKCRRVVLPSDSYDLVQKKGRKLPYVSLYIDCENEVILEETPLANFPYTIPRWVTVSGSQYAYSPATVVGLPDARLLQDITLTLLESGQKAVDPPMKAVHEAVIGGLNAQAGGLSVTTTNERVRLSSPCSKSSPGWTTASSAKRKSNSFSSGPSSSIKSVCRTYRIGLQRTRFRSAWKSISDTHFPSLSRWRRNTTERCVKARLKTFYASARLAHLLICLLFYVAVKSAFNSRALYRLRTIGPRLRLTSKRPSCSP
jgi:hypothetical protein